MTKLMIPKEDKTISFPCYTNCYSLYEFFYTNSHMLFRNKHENSKLHANKHEVSKLHASQGDAYCIKS